MAYIPAERGTYQQRRRIVQTTDPAARSAAEYGAAYFDLVVLWEVGNGQSIHDPGPDIIPVTIGDINAEAAGVKLDLWYGEVTTILPSDATVVR